MINVSSNEIFCNGEKLKLTKKEYKLIQFLIMNKNVVFSKDKIFNNVWEVNSESYLETVTECIKNIRKKLKDLDKENSYITTVYGLGYRWEVKNEK